MRQLSSIEYERTIVDPMTPAGADDAPPFDFWAYFDAIPEGDRGGFDFSAGRVGRVYRSADGRYEHVLVRCGRANVFLVLVLDLEVGAVHGHRLLDLDREYGLEDGTGRP